MKAAVLAFSVTHVEHLYKASLMLGRKTKCAFKIILPISFLAQKSSLNFSPLTESRAKIFPTDLSWGAVTAARDVTFNPAFIPPSGGIYPSLPWVKSPSLLHTWHRCWSLVHLASSPSLGSSHNTCSFLSVVFHHHLCHGCSVVLSDWKIEQIQCI